MFHRCYECPALQAERDMYVLTGGAASAARAVGSQYREQFAHDIFPDPGAILPTGFLERECQVFCHNQPPDGLLEGHIFTRRLFVGQRCAATGWLGSCGGRRYAGNLNAAAHGAVPSDVLPGQSARDGEDHAAAMAGHIITLDPLTLHIDCEGTIATVNGPKCKALGAGVPEHTSGTGFCFSHDEVRAVKVKGHATERDVEAGRTFPLVQKGKRLCQTTSQKKCADTHKPAFRVAKTVVACASLAKQAARWAAEAHVLLRFRGWSDTRTSLRHDHRDHGHDRHVGDSSASGAKRLQRRRRVRCATGFLSVVPTRFSQDSYLDPRTFRGHSLQFSMLEAELWTTPSSFAPSVERSTGSVRMLSARQCSEFPAGRASQLRKLRSGPWLDSRTLSSPHSGRGYCFGGSAGILRGWFGQNGHGAYHPKKATGGSAGSGASGLGTCRRGYRQREPSAAAFRPEVVEFMGGVWAQRSVGDKARPQGWRCSPLTRQADLATHPCSLFCSPRPRRDIGVMCAVGGDGSSSSEYEADPYNIWNVLLAALVHFPHWRGAAAAAYVGRGGLCGIVMPLCLRRVMRRAL